MSTVPGNNPAFALNFVECGPPEAPLTVLVHAVGLDLTWWGQQIDALSSRYHVVAYDLLGHGASSTPLCGYSLDELAGDLAAVIRGVGGTVAHIIGHSVGGMIAQVLALEQPEIVRSLTLIDTAATFTDAVRAAIRQRAQTTRRGGMGAMLQQTIERWFTPGFTARRPDVIDRCIKILLSNSKDVHAAMWDAIARHDAALRLHEVRCPALVLVGEQDATTPPAAARELAASIPRARLQVIADAAHLSIIEAPDVVNQQILEFLGAHA